MQSPMYAVRIFQIQAGKSGLENAGIPSDIVLVPFGPDPIDCRVASTLLLMIDALTFYGPSAKLLFLPFDLAFLNRILRFYQSGVDELKGGVKLFEKIKEKRQIRKAQKKLSDAIRNSSLNDMLSCARNKATESEAVDAIISMHAERRNNSELLITLLSDSFLLNSPAILLKIIDNLFDRVRVIEYLKKNLSTDMDIWSIHFVFEQIEYDIHEIRRIFIGAIPAKLKNISIEKTNAKKINSLRSICMVAGKLKDAQIFKTILATLRNGLASTIFSPLDKNEISSAMFFLGESGIEAISTTLLKEIKEADLFDIGYILDGDSQYGCMAYPTLLRDVLMEIARQYGGSEVGIKAKAELAKYGRLLNERAIERLLKYKHIKTGFTCGKCGRPVYKDMLKCPHCDVSLVTG